MKIRTWLSNDFNDFKSNPGDGKKVPQFELNEKTNLLQVKLDKDGNRVFHNLYNDIQVFRDTNSIERILSLAQDGDIEKLDFRCTSEQEARSKDVDYTNIKTMAEMKDLQNKLASQGKTLDDLQNYILRLLKERSASVEKQNKKQETKIVDETKKEVKENEKEKDKK